jgi:microcystin-dependent protein
LYLDIYSIIGLTYGGDGASTFALPDLRGASAVHAGQAPTMQMYYIGQNGGNEQLTLTADQLPGHNHPQASVTAKVGPPCSSQPGTTDIPAQNYPAQVNGVTAAYSTTVSDAFLGISNITAQSQLQGGTSGVGIVSPYLAMNYIICISGNYPSRN